MNLNLLTGGNVDMRALHLARYLGHSAQLAWGDKTAGATDAQHVMTVLSLLVDAHWHTVRLELCATYLTFLKLLYEPLIILYVCYQTFGNRVHIISMLK